MNGMRVATGAALVALCLALGACSTSKGTRASSSGVDVGSSAGGTGGGYYLDDGPGRLSPADVAAIPDAVPRPEPVLLRTARPYMVFGRTYTPMNALAPYRERGMASWYGKRYHGKPTSSGEPYDMYAMTAAHPTLPIPSYVRVTRVATGRSVVVRVNDRGPFLQNRLIDLSYTAAAKLGFVEAGSAEVEVETITQFDGPAAPVLVAGDAAQRPQGAVAASTVQASAAPAPAPARSATAAQVADETARPAAAQLADEPTPLVAAAPAAGEPPRLVAASSSFSVDAATAAPPPEAAPARLVVETKFSDGAGSPDGRSASSGEVNTPHRISPSSTPAVAASLSQAAAGGTSVAAAQSAHDMNRVSRTGFWLQFGAFASADGARAALERIRRELAWLGARFDLREEGGFYKVQAGPWPQRERALEAAARVRGVSALQPFAIFR